MYRKLNADEKIADGDEFRGTFTGEWRKVRGWTGKSVTDLLKDVRSRLPDLEMRRKVVAKKTNSCECTCDIFLLMNFGHNKSCSHYKE